MFVRDIMSYNVVTISSDTYVLDAERIMEFHKVSRLPVVDKGILVGIVTKDAILRASPSSTTPYNQRQLFYLMSKLTVSEIMKPNVITIPPDTTIEKAVSIAQQNRVGSLPVIENGSIIGIITTIDVFYRVLNPLLGVGTPGHRIMIEGVIKNGTVPKIMDYMNHAGHRITSFWIPPDGRLNLVLHLDVEDVTPVVNDLTEMGFKVFIREHRT